MYLRREMSGRCGEYRLSGLRGEYLTLSGDEWEHERPREKQTETKPSIKERLEQSRKECTNQSKAQPHREKPAPEL